MSKPVKISTVLTRAAKYIEENGLTKGYHWRYRNGRLLSPSMTAFEQAQVAIEKRCPACAWGGIYAGAYRPGIDEDEFDRLSISASAYVREVLGDDGWDIPDWNDRPERTQDEVVQALKDAAKAARKDGK